MNDWGRATYGDPCRECGYEWSIREGDAVALVTAAPNRYAEAVRGADASRRHPDLGWSARAYVCHVTDNLRIWAERLVGAALDGPLLVVPYDNDLLASGRAYDGVPIEGALWSLGKAVEDWNEAIAVANQREVRLLHPERGELVVTDVVRTNAHDVHHHEWDIRRSVGADTSL